MKGIQSCDLVTTFLETAGLKVKIITKTYHRHFLVQFIDSFPAPIHGVFPVKTTFFYLTEYMDSCHELFSPPLLRCSYD